MICQASLRADDFLVPAGAVEHHTHEGGKVKALPLFEIRVDHGEKLVVVEEAIVEEKPRREAHDLRIETHGILISCGIELLKDFGHLLWHVPIELASIRTDRHDAESAQIVDAYIVLAEVIGKPALLLYMAKRLVLLLKRRRQPALSKLHSGRQKRIDERRQRHTLRPLQAEVVRQVVQLFARKAAQSLLERAVFGQCATIKALSALLLTHQDSI